jgi:hypothetical protein
MALVRRVIGFIAALFVLILVFGGGWVAGRFGIGDAAVDPATLSNAERQFVERMRGASLIGNFTVEGRESNRAPREDRYDIDSVEKVGDDLWRFNAGMKCCGVNGVIPVVVPMRFVGDTPMIMMTDTSLPALGTFTVRLIFYEDRYAGTWQHGEVGGLMSGRIEKQAASTDSSSQ